MIKSLCVSFLLMLPAILFAQRLPNATNVPVPTPLQLGWQEAELVALFDYDLHVFDGKPYKQPVNRITPIADYNIFSPEQLDTDQWVRAARDMGAKIAILTATHETGFALYQSEVNPYCLKAVQWRDGKGDIVRDFVNSCRKYGLKPGIYIGIRWNSFFGVHDFKVNGEGEFAKNRQKQYKIMVEGMVKEICTKYGELAVIWFDGGADSPRNGGPDVLSIVEKYQPNCLFYHNLERADFRWGGSESGTVAYPCWGTFPYPVTGAGETARPEIGKNNFQLLKTGDPDGKYYLPAMSDAPLRGFNGGHEWFWEPGQEQYIYPLEKLMHMYYNSVGHNSTLILGITPDDRGLVPEPDMKRMQELGREIKKRFGQPLAEVSGDADELRVNLPSNQPVNQVVLQENIIFGERVRSFVLEGKTSSGWKILYEGSSIGHKHIALFPEKKVKALRVRVKNSRGRPMLKSMKIYYQINDKN